MTEDPKKEQSRKQPPENDADITAGRDHAVDSEQVCEKAPEWAEHQRLWDDDEPCDDGRSGRLGNK